MVVLWRRCSNTHAWSRGMVLTPEGSRREYVQIERRPQLPFCLGKCYSPRKANGVSWTGIDCSPCVVQSGFCLTKPPPVTTQIHPLRGQDWIDRTNKTEKPTGEKRSGNWQGDDMVAIFEILLHRNRLDFAILRWLY